MSDEPFYAPSRTPAPPRQPKPGELLFESVRASDRALISCELRFHGESYGWEVQFLFYGCILFEPPLPHLIILLDGVPDARRVALATALGISIVVEKVEGEFELLNSAGTPALSAVFARATAAQM